MAAPYDGKLITHLGGGLAADRPAAPNTAPGILCIWYSTDTNAFSFWESGAAVWSADYVPVGSASGITFTPYGDLAATDVQAALEELDDEKMPIAGGTFTGDIVVPDEVYDATAWNASLEVPTKNALRDIIESLAASIPGGYTTEQAQDAVGAMVDATLVYDDATPALKRAAITGHVTIADGSNAAALGSFTKAQLDTAVSDGNILYVGDVTQYTDELAQDAVAALLVAGTNITLTYNDVANTLTIAASGGGAADIDDLSDVDTTTVAPTVGDVLEWDGTNWVPAAPSGGGGTTDLLGFSSSETATAGLNISSPVDLANMSVTFTIATGEVVIVEAAFLASRSSGYVRGALFVNGVAFTPGGANNNFYSDAQGENSIHRFFGRWPVTLAAGTHTIKIQVSDALAVATTTFYARLLEVRSSVTA